MKTLQIDIVSDVMCPWCYIGKKRLEKAIDQLDGAVALDIHWRPYQLDATLPKAGKDRKQYLEDKFGGAERAELAYASVREAGAGDGIPFDFDAIAVSPNTLDAHRLIRWSASSGPGVQGRLVDILFRRYFTEGQNIGDASVLLDAAQEAGMDRSIVEPLLAGDADRAAVEQDIATAQAMGVNGVPCFIIDNKYAVMGAQPADALAKAIADIAFEKGDASA